MERIGFIGLGLMGKPMAKRLLMHGYRLAVYNRSKAPVKELSELGAEPADSPKSVAKCSEVVIVMVPDSGDVVDVVLGDEGIIKGIVPGSVVIDMSTISPAVEVEVAKRLKEVGVDYLDAPVTGGTIGAETGKLTIMVGGMPDVFERCLPIFRVLGEKVLHMGGVGSGQMAKLCNQIAVAMNLLGVCEMITFAKANGLDVDAVIEAVKGGAGSSWQLANLGPRIVARDFAPGFKLEHLAKDLRIALEVAEKTKVPLFGSSLVHQLLKSLVRKGFGSEGTQALIRAYEALT